MTSQVVRKPAERGLVGRDADPADSRAKRVAITAARREVLTGALVDVEAADAAFLAGRDDLVRGLVGPGSPAGPGPSANPASP
ncbi:hypothetical protein SUDANB95_06245 [Actinosynnema sp. ALI-1.44]